MESMETLSEVRDLGESSFEKCKRARIEQLVHYGRQQPATSAHEQNILLDDINSIISREISLEKAGHELSGESIAEKTNGKTVVIQGDLIQVSTELPPTSSDFHSIKIVLSNIPTSGCTEKSPNYSCPQTNSQLILARQKWQTSVSSLMKKLSKCAVCGTNFGDSKPATACLAKHGKKQCWICLDVVPIQLYSTHCKMYHCSKDPKMKFKVRCRYCDKYFDYQNGINQHITKKHFAEIKNIQMGRVSANTLAQKQTGGHARKTKQPDDIKSFIFPYNIANSSVRTFTEEQNSVSQVRTIEQAHQSSLCLTVSSSAFRENLLTQEGFLRSGLEEAKDYSPPKQSFSNSSNSGIQETEFYALTQKRCANANYNAYLSSPLKVEKVLDQKEFERWEHPNNNGERRGQCDETSLPKEYFTRASHHHQQYETPSMQNTVLDCVQPIIPHVNNAIMGVAKPNFPNYVTEHNDDMNVRPGEIPGNGKRSDSLNIFEPLLGLKRRILYKVKQDELSITEKNKKLSLSSTTTTTTLHDVYAITSDAHTSNIQLIGQIEKEHKTTDEFLIQDLTQSENLDNNSLALGHTLANDNGSTEELFSYLDQFTYLQGTSTSTSASPHYTSSEINIGNYENICRIPQKVDSNVSLMNEGQPIQHFNDFLPVETATSEANDYQNFMCSDYPSITIPVPFSQAGQIDENEVFRSGTTNFYG